MNSQKTSGKRYRLHYVKSKHVAAVIIQNQQRIAGGGTYGLPLDEYEKLLQQNNLQMVSYGADFDELTKDPQKIIKDAKAFGSKFIMCSWIPHKEGVFTIDETKKAIDVFNTAGK